MWARRSLQSDVAERLLVLAERRASRPREPLCMARLIARWASGGPLAILWASVCASSINASAGTNPGHEPDAQRLLGVDEVAGQRQLERLRPTLDELRG